VRAYRERQLADTGFDPLFPLWGLDTRALAERFIAEGFKAVIVCVDTQQLPPAFAGRNYDRDLLRELPATVDPCGENGEFHSFVAAGPVFDSRIPFVRGEVVLRDGRFAYCDLEPGRP
jgi:diphthamide synthase (EF-2-diphthine--ammonia ligase)